MVKHWVAFFSQSGKEIADLSEKLGRWPTRIVTNKRPTNLRIIDPRVLSHNPIYLPNKPTVGDYLDLLQYFENPILTLHGWLRIIPEEVCNMYPTYNGHPGLITKYKQLVGKDPQIRAWKGIKEGEMTMAGTVLHKVTAGVDEGPIISSSTFNPNPLEFNEFVSILRDKSIELWLNFLRSQ